MTALVALGVALTGSGSLSSPIGYQMLMVGKAKYHVVTADMSSGRVAASTVHSPRLTSVWSLLSHGKPVAAITGTFFGLHNQTPVADVLVDGNLVARGSRGSAIGVSYFGAVKVFTESFRKPVDWGEYQFGLRGAVSVVENGKVAPNPKAQKFRDSRIWGRAARTAVGTTKSGKLVLMATKSQVTLSELGRALKSRGVQNGVSLDGGGSTCLFYQGSLVIPPNRKLSNMFVLSRKQDAEAVAASIGP